jgi:Amidohydrolase
VTRSRFVAALLVLAVGSFAPAGRAAGAEDLPIFDTHLHYSRNAWAQYAPEAVLAILDRAGVQRAFVSSTPDDGTLQLHQAAPDRIVPVLRPYRESGDQGTWHADASVVAYLEERLRRGVHRGFGEFHLYGDDARSVVVRQVADLARQRGLFLHCHCDAEAVEILLGLGADLRILWAHAGMSSGPDVVGRLVARHRNLSVELALRTDVAPGGRLDPDWRALFLQYPDRFMVGTDTWTPSRWNDVPAAQAAVRVWLRQLPPDIAARIARENAERLAAGKP